MGQFLTLSTTIRVKTQLHHQTTLQKVGQWISSPFFFSQFAIICSHIKNLFSETVSKIVRWDSTKPWFNFFLLESKHETTNFIRLDSVAPSVRSLHIQKNKITTVFLYIGHNCSLFFFGKFWIMNLWCIILIDADVRKSYQLKYLNYELARMIVRYCMNM